MANTDYASQLTQIYNKLVAIDAQMSKLALLSDMNSKQEALTISLNSIASSLVTLTDTVQKLELNMSELLAELRSK